MCSKVIDTLRLSKLPSSNKRFWKGKLSSNRDRDIVAMLALMSAGWRVANVWECALRGKPALERLDRAMNDLVHWVRHPATGALLELSALAPERARDAN